ncbi:DUF2490 domain-containing protein [Tunicatimonas pelagia]|uniref:DUF2490 domain-containing protein n=1 Tax=Tunicatimonas pelagia TaxID=931531 RepID=UPI0026663BC2|nr:DUF2490 domain-containing protein [Tunicatimonas pelagia]WKN43445.1 DUF2490 domain-containing protein [Tunicatimonas pelagia]
MRKILLAGILIFLNLLGYAQGGPDEDQLGAWYMYFFNKRFGESQFGIQGDYQFRFWNLGGDLEQILLRTGATYRPKNADILFTLGYANITTGTPGESTSRTNENRIYQEALFSQRIGSRFLLTHRIRYEQRWVADQDLRTRYRYNLFVNVPLNNTDLAKRTVYLALYNEIFINGQTDVGDGLTVQFFDRNRTYLGVGYGLLDNLRMQVGWMKQTTANWSKGQAQLSLHHNF